VLVDPTGRDELLACRALRETAMLAGLDLGFVRGLLAAAPRAARSYRLVPVNNKQRFASADERHVNVRVEVFGEVLALEAMLVPQVFQNVSVVRVLPAVLLPAVGEDFECHCLAPFLRHVVAARAV
jgi:hypothetical protein